MPGFLLHEYDVVSSSSSRKEILALFKAPIHHATKYPARRSVTPPDLLQKLQHFGTGSGEWCKIVCAACVSDGSCAVGILKGVEQGVDMLFSMFPTSRRALLAASYARTADTQSLAEEYAKNLRTMVSGELPRRVCVLSYCVTHVCRALPA